MDVSELRRAQEPLKQRYREDAASARVTLQAEGELGENVTCSVQTGRALVEAGLHPATGGTGLSVCSGDMLLQALVACAGVTMQAVATSIGVDVSGSIRAEGDLDFRGTLAVDKQAPVGFMAIRLTFDLRTDATEDRVATLVALTERFCVVLQTLRNPPSIDVVTRTGPAATAGA